VFEEILQAIDEQIIRLEQAKKALQGAKTNSPKPAATAARKTRTPRRRRLSAQARRAIAEAQRKRWARVKAAAVNTGEKKEIATS
jgi:hypothetical protein